MLLIKKTPLFIQLTGVWLSPEMGLGIIIRLHEVGLTYPDVLPIRQCTFPYGHHSVSHHIGYTIRCNVPERSFKVQEVGFAPTRLGYPIPTLFKGLRLFYWYCRPYLLPPLLYIKENRRWVSGHLFL